VDSLVAVRIGSLVLQNDLSPAGWIIDQIHGFATDVGSVIPQGFEAYARLFHPAIRIVNGEEVTVRWSEIAAAGGRTVHPEMQWPHVSGMWEGSGENSPGLWDLEPDVGSLPRRYTDRLRDLLAQYTSTSDRVWFCVWDGFGDLKIRPGGSALLTSGPPGRKRRPVQQSPAPTLQLPNRAYYLLSGPIGGIGESMGEEPHWQSANLIWPEDRAWCVATEIDFAWTYIGGGTALIQALINDPALEAMPTQIHHGITYEADRINPPPARP
jgi:hypothetical protein